MEEWYITARSDITTHYIKVNILSERFFFTSFIALNVTLVCVFLHNIIVRWVDAQCQQIT